MATLIFVHGACVNDAAWWWNKMTAPLAERGISTVAVRLPRVRRLFLQDCDETTTTQALSRLTRQSLAPFGQAPREIAWRRKPTTYIVCTEDLATPAQAQRQRVKGDTLAVDFPAGHHPFLSQPEAFARCLATVVRALQPSHS